MNRVFLLGFTSFFLLLAGCASNDTRSKNIYTKTEYSKMTYCIGLADTANFVAAKKLKGTPKQELIDLYSSRKYAKLNIATVNRVYSANFKNSWDYTVSFFNECANNLAGVTANRVKFASYCSQNSMIANVAHTLKVSGSPKERAYKVFAKFKSETPNRIIDKVYASSMKRSEAKLDAWNTCMLKVSDS